MNFNKLKSAEANFLQMFPAGFEDEGLVEVRKRHNLTKMNQLALEVFREENFYVANQFLKGLVKVVSGSSMLSMFEKPKFRDMISSLNSAEKELLTSYYRELFHGDQENAFDAIVDMLALHKMAKWSVVTISMSYYRPESEVFIKPTTTKKIISELGLNLIYRPRPTWSFYERYREIVLEIKKNVRSSLSPNNAALTGFLMIAL